MMKTVPVSGLRNEAGDNIWQAAVTLIVFLLMTLLNLLLFGNFFSIMDKNDFSDVG